MIEHKKEEDHSTFTFTATIIITQIINFFITDDFEPMTAYFLNIVLGSALYIFILSTQKSPKRASDKISYSTRDIWFSYSAGVTNATIMIPLHYWSVIM